MKTRKSGFITVLALLTGVVLCTALMLSGCPAPITDPGEPGGVTPPGPSEGTQYAISLQTAPSNGQVAINPERAAQGDTVTITLRPSPNFEPNDVVIWRTGNFPIEPTISGYVYTFTMPASPVQVRVDFIRVIDKIANVSTRITTSSSWDEIDDLNTLIKRAVNPTAASARQVTTQADAATITTAVEKLAGKTTGTGEDATHTPGIIELKMRNEDLAKWIPLKTSPSYPIDKGVRDENLTHVYYVEENDPDIPSLVSGKGWVEEGRIVPAAVPDAPLNLHQMTEIRLTYEVGAGTNRAEIRYKILMWPTAQYTIEYVQGATSGIVTIQDFYPGAEPDKDGAQMLVTQRTGNVGRVPGTSDTFKRPYVQVVTPDTNIMISVLDSRGNVIRGWTPTTTDTDTDATEPTSVNRDLLSITSTTPGAFYSESRQYTIRVRPVTPPNPAAVQ